jgi:hypothetical protein
VGYFLYAALLSRLFVQSEADCSAICQETTDCRFFYWYTIDYSPAPLYCYLFRRYRNQQWGTVRSLP